jgi:hypothetical protein
MKAKNPKSEAELQQYIHKFKLDTQQDANRDMEANFDKANTLEQKLHADLIVFASVMLTIMGGIIAAGDITLSSRVKLAMTVGMLLLLASIFAGLATYRSMSKFWVTWAKAKLERGRIIELDHSKTFEDLVELRQKLMDYESKLPEQSPKLFGRIQLFCFIVGLLVVVAAILGILFNFGL